MAMTKTDFAALIAAAKAKKNAALIATTVTKPAEVNAFETELNRMMGIVTEVDTTALGATNEEVIETVSDLISSDIVETSANRAIGVQKNVTLNAKQQLFLDTVVSGQSCCLLGAAGTGKTTSVRQTSRALLDSGRIGKIVNATKYLVAESPGIAVVAFTRKAVNNIKHAVVDELKRNVITLHKLLEFAPTFYEIEDKETGGWKKTMKFEPKRCESFPLPPELSIIIHEESSMEGVDLYNLLQKAMPHKHQEVFLGDIQQLPPVFGLAILGFKMTSLPVVELTEVYRQALDSPILSLAWSILQDGPDAFAPKTEKYETVSPVTGKKVTRIKCPGLDKYTREHEGSSCTIKVWQKQLDVDNAINTTAVQLKTWFTEGSYNPEKDIILQPFNKAYGTIELNKKIAQFVGEARIATVYHVIAGFNDHYLAVGDRVLYDKEDAIITAIRRNAGYLGKSPQPHSVHLNRWGEQLEKLSIKEVTEAEEIGGIDALEEFMSTNDIGEDGEVERVQAASHIVEIQYLYGDNDEPIVLNSAADINNLLGGYAITVHKSQGSEYQKVYIFLNHSHATMVSRELLYTAVTRAKQHLFILCEPHTFQKGVASQRIKGDTLAEKAEQFKGKAERSGNSEYAQHLLAGVQ